MELFRLTRQKYADSLSGKGAAIFGNRWNSKGTSIIYTAQNRSLAMAEVAVHFTLQSAAQDYHMLVIYVPDDTSIFEIHSDNLPITWNSFPHTKATQVIGDEFIQNNAKLLMKVPSVVTRGDYNYLINPYHPDFQKVKIIDKEPFPFDGRLLK